MIRISAALAAPLLALTLLSVPATAAPGGKVTTSDLLTTAQVAQAFPSKAPLTRATRTIRATPVYRSCTRIATVRVRSGRRAEIAPSNQATTSTAGVPYVTQEVVRLKTARAARKLVKSWQTLPRRCSTMREDGATTRVTRLTVPALGKQRAGVTFTTKVGATSAVGDVHVVRRGNRVLTLVVSYSQGPRRTNSAALLRTAYATAF